MKILIAYDGSEPAKAAIEDLKRAGLPQQNVQAMVVTAEEAHTAMTPAFNLDPGLPILTYAFESAHETILYAQETAEIDAEQGVEHVKQIFPQWDVTPSVHLEPPAPAILEVADWWKPDLIVMGSHGRSGISRLFLGSVSLRVMREAETAVRISHNKPESIVDDADPAYPPVLLLAFDGSEGSNRAVHHLLDRSWPNHTQIHIVAVIDVSILSTRNYLWLVGEDLTQYQDMNESRIEHSVHDLEREMRKASPTMSFDVTSAIQVGSPIHEILSEAKRVQADTIFMGSRGLSRLERMLLGSVVQGVVSHAETTVEIVR
ncbi:MAG TPA: universal stress protein [Candidatus Kapabacteria bacterium]|nr:universal stress protein [Candidatus Kapabacteria bacterium]